ncbi:MAG: peptidylprolyl isomerase, partial [Flavobacteriales bacterium]
MNSFFMKSIIISFLFISSFSLFAQPEPNDVLISIDDNHYTVEEFSHIYNKNRALAEQVDPKTLDEYLDLFVQFKLKVLDAEASGYANKPSFKTEFNGYKKQIAKSFLTDSETEDAILKETYERLRYEVKASHILITCAENASPADTLKAYNTAIEARNKINKGADFVSIAKAYSKDPSVVKNEGDLGFFTVLKMVYPFETAAYNTKVGEVSMPVRTQFGYHILNVTDKRLNPGERQVAHLFLKHPKDGNEAKIKENKKKIDEIYGKLKTGADFSKLVKTYSQDTKTASRGGMMDWFGTGSKLEAFENAAFALKENNEISAPFETKYGYHILKLLGSRNIGSFENEADFLRKKLATNERTLKSSQAFIDKLKKEYNFVFHEEGIKTLLPYIETKEFNAQEWTPNTLGERFQMPVFTFANQTFSQLDLLNTLHVRRKELAATPAKIKYIMNGLAVIAKAKILAYEETQLDRKYPKYRLLIQEYHDGMLLYEVSKERIWDKAIEDTTAVKSYFEAHPDEFMYAKRIEATLFECAS